MSGTQQIVAPDISTLRSKMQVNSGIIQHIEGKKTNYRAKILMNIEIIKIQSRKIYQSILQEPIKDRSIPTIKIKIPKHLMTTELIKENHTHVGLIGESSNKYYDIYDKMRDIPQLEYLKDKELKQKIDNFTCELFIGGKKYKEKKNLTSKIDEFFEEIIKPFKKYEVNIGLSNIVLMGENLQIGKILLFKPDTTYFDTIKSNIHDTAFVNQYQNVSNVVAKLYETGNNPNFVGERARERLKEALSILKITKQTDKYLNQDWIQIRFSEMTLFITDSIPQKYLFNWHREMKPGEIGFGSTDETDRYDEFSNLLGSVSEEIQSKIKIALHWIDLSYIEEKYDIKHLYLCTALEAILSQISDRKKGAILALRIFTMASHFGGTFMPADLFYQIYVERSFLVHGSKININAKKKYTIFLLETQNAVRYMLKICIEFGIQKHNAFLDKLNTLPSRETTINYMKKFNSRGNEDIIKELNL